jgi:hypothetical protein
MWFSHGISVQWTLHITRGDMAQYHPVHPSGQSPVHPSGQSNLTRELFYELPAIEVWLCRKAQPNLNSRQLNIGPCYMESPLYLWTRSHQTWHIVSFYRKYLLNSASRSGPQDMSVNMFSQWCAMSSKLDDACLAYHFSRWKVHVDFGVSSLESARDR